MYMCDQILGLNKKIFKINIAFHNLKIAFEKVIAAIFMQEYTFRAMKPTRGKFNLYIPNKNT